MLDAVMRLAIYLAPMYVANSTAMIFGGKTPIDLGRNMPDGKRVFGQGKTFRGFAFGVTLGTVTGALIWFALPQAVGSLSGQYLLLGFLLSLGAITGDMVASFFKRRNNIEQGKEVLFLDQLDFAIGAMLFGSVVYVPDFYEIVAVCIVTLVAHKIFNYIAFKAKLKKVPW